MASLRILSTKNYRQFERAGGENRPLDLKKHCNLIASMKKYGFIKTFPIIVTREPGGTLIIKDGQHRLAIAEMLGLTVYWVEDDVDFDVAVVNCTQKPWVVRDYALKHASSGIAAYREGLEFAESFSLPIGAAFALLAGTASFSNCQKDFINGTFRVKDRDWADAVAGIYAPLVAIAPSIKSKRFIEACMAVCRVAQFDPERLLANARKIRNKLVPYSTRDAYLTMLEEIYNYKRQHLFGLRVAAISVMRDRRPFVRGGSGHEHNLPSETHG